MQANLASTFHALQTSFGASPLLVGVSSLPVQLVFGWPPLASYDLPLQPVSSSLRPFAPLAVSSIQPLHA